MEIAQKLLNFMLEPAAAIAVAEGQNYPPSLDPSKVFEGWMFLLLGLTPILPTALMLELLNRDRDRYSSELDKAVRQAAVIVTPVLTGLTVWKAMPEHIAGPS